MSRYNGLGSKGFTLAELLISLAILGVIATFTVPKILTSQQNIKYGSLAKEDIAMVSGAYQQYLNDYGSAPTTFGIKDLTPYMNFVMRDSTSTIDYYYTSTTTTCNYNSGFCLRLHNGSYLKYWGDSFGSTVTTSTVPFLIDPDGQVTDSTTNSPGKSVQIWLVRTGRIVDDGNVPATGLTYSGGAVSASLTKVPPW